jgi:hypothetical protein
MLLTSDLFKPGAVIDLGGQTATVPNPMKLTTHGWTLKNGTVVFNGAMNARALSDWGSGNTIQNIAWSLGTGNHAAELHGSGFTARNCVVQKGGGLLYLLGASNTLADSCSGVAERNFISSWSAGPGKATDNSNLTITNCNVSKIVYEHAYRFHCLTGLLIDSGTISGQGSVTGKDPLTLHDGANFVVRKITVDGWSDIGGLEIVGNETKTLAGVELDNCWFKDRVVVVSGVSGLKIFQCAITGTNGGCIQVRGPYGIRKAASGLVEQCSGTAHDSRDAWIMGTYAQIQQRDNTFNGMPVSTPAPLVHH